MGELKPEIANLDIDTKGIIIFWKQWSGKTLMGIAMVAWLTDRIYSNVDIYKKGDKINKSINKISDIYSIWFSKKPWVVIIDEAGINANSKDTMKKENRVLQEFLFLVRKKNCSLIWIAQRYESIDINARVLADLIIKMKKIRRKDKTPLFEGTKIYQKMNKTIELDSYTCNLITLLKKLNLTYNTLQSSKFG